LQHRTAEKNKASTLAFFQRKIKGDYEFNNKFKWLQRKIKNRRRAKASMPTNILLGVFMRLITFLLIIFPSICSAQCPDWTPDFKFKIEDADVPRTMVWLSGWVFSLQATQDKTGYCLSECGYLDSKKISEILNEYHVGQVIRAETAAITIEENLDKEFSCK
jgi:hypothetical protein